MQPIHKRNLHSHLHGGRRQVRGLDLSRYSVCHLLRRAQRMHVLVRLVLPKWSVCPDAVRDCATVTHCHALTLSYAGTLSSRRFRRLCFTDTPGPCASKSAAECPERCYLDQSAEDESTCQDFRCDVIYNVGCCALLSLLSCAFHRAAPCPFVS